MAIQKLDESRVLLKFLFTERYADVRAKLLFLRQNLSRAANRGDKSQHIDITLDYLFEIGEQQRWRCALSDQNLEFVRGGQIWRNYWCNPKICTIDRIDSSEGYVVDNIQLLSWDINYIKQNLPNSEFVELCKKVADHHTK